MDYREWAAAYREDACRVLDVIEKKKTLLNDKKLSSDTRKMIGESLVVYRRIHRELLKTAEHLQRRGDRHHAA